MSDGNPYKFNSPAELMDMIKELGYDPDQQPRPVIDISRTPFETLWPTHSIEHSEGNGPKAEYTSVAFGDDVPTPWGPLPRVILLLRKDVEAKLLKDGIQTPDRQAPASLAKPWTPPKKKFDLFPPGWKPAPGFTDPRKEW